MRISIVGDGLRGSTRLAGYRGLNKSQVGRCRLIAWVSEIMDLMLQFFAYDHWIWRLERGGADTCH